MAQIRADAFEGALTRGLPPLVWIHGDEPLLVQEAADTVRAAARAADFQERRVFDVDRSFRTGELTAEAGALSLFASSKLIEVRFSGKPGKEHGESIADLAEGLDPSVRLLVISGRLERSITESAWFGRLERLALVLVLYPVERRELPRWIAARLARQQQRAEADTLDWIAERVEGNLLAAYQEVRKLGLLCGPGLLPAEQVREAVMSVARYDAFDLAEAMLAGDRGRALRSLEGLRAEGEAPPVALWAVSDATRTLLRLHAARQGGQPLAQALRAARVFGPREKLYEGALRRIPPSNCRLALRHCALIDRMIKGVPPGNAWHALERVVMLLAGVPLSLDH